MNSETKEGYLRLDLSIVKDGALSESEAQKIESDLLKFFEDKSLVVKGKLQFVMIKTLELNIKP